MSDRLVGLLTKLSKRSDLVIAMLVITAVVMVIIPLPTFLIDTLITANIAVSVLILLVSFYVTHPLEFSSLPSVILMSTLFRLAITISTTRLILTQADAGEIISAFGAFVVGGSIAVGLVVFLIITVAQFVVVAKGAERVAEVAARFTLDALPGKQMSIDAELRNGDIDQAEARRLRNRLERESQLFGAMDGAMKFVKGDVIAGIIIILVNLIGGFTVGTLQHGMSLGEAASTYSLLTVGDGLVAQIPALLVAVGAGTIVTRVAGAEGQDDLARQISGQLLRDPRALAVAAAIMIGLSLVPGFPMFAFLALGAAFGFGAYVSRRSANQEHPADDGIVSAEAEAEAGGALLAAKGTAVSREPSRLVARFGSALGRAVPEAEFAGRASTIRTELLEDLGIDVPGIGYQVDDDLAPWRIRIDLDGAPIFDVEVPDDGVLVEGSASNLELLGIDYRTGPTVIGQRETVWVEPRHLAALQEAGVRTLTSVEMSCKWLDHALRIYAGNFIGIQEARTLLTGMEADYGDLVREVQEALPLQKISEVLRRLVAENVPIGNLRPILEALIEWGRREEDVVLLAEYVRAALKRQISFRAADRNNVIAAYILQPSAEEVLRAAVQDSSAGAFVNLLDDRVQSLSTQIGQALAQTSAGVLPVVLTSMDLRRHMRSLLLHNGIVLPVLSFQELAPEFSVQPLAGIAVKDTGSGEGREARALPPMENRATQETVT
ncbi:type III secretion system export apparatus subunit SctV [Nitratireductor pacificus]|uniref:Putative type III secretion pore protein n=1 Tax=Nitratireductor pacificus pht-3B TaxID=391937 RepID=K2M9L1_9HYPH|nr:type III secretion system export apparatus subunit SctV [Nitratireductor pacificus]EKF17680.1 putative type III secretion pore protein [Nitratireductor pacificus pht-3B]